MKILFVYKMLSFNIRDPLGLLYIISTAKKEGNDCLLLIYDLEKDFFKKAAQFKPDLVCYSVTTGSEQEYLNINTLLKKRLSFISVFGGPHATFCPHFIEEKGVDIICRGEAELSFGELLHRMREKEDIYTTANFWFKRDGHILKNELRPLIEDLDTILFPDRELVNRYFDYRKFGRINVITGRGCPFDCSYCFNGPMKKLYCGKGKYVRQRSVDNIISEIRECVKAYGAREVYFVDDIFGLDRKWLSEFAGRYRQEVKLPYLCHLRANLVTEEDIRLLHESGCFCVWFGIESGSENMRERILNRYMTNEQICRASEWLRKYKIKAVTFNMVGLPNETIENVFETIRLNVRCRPSYAWVSILQPYPGTEIRGYSIRNNLLKEHYSIKPDYHSLLPFKLKEENQLLNLNDFFAFMVQFPFLISAARIMIRFPRNGLFRAMNYLLKMVNYAKTGEIKIRYWYMKYVLKYYSVKVSRAMSAK